MTPMPRRLRKPARIILIGPPGVGKGTQTERLLARFPQLASISSGDLLRENVRKKTALGLKAESSIQSGSLVPDSVMLDLISSELKTRGWLPPAAPRYAAVSASPAGKPSISPSASFILDGFPRTASQASSLEKLLPVNLVVHLLTPPAIIISRIASRWIHAPSGRVYNTYFNPPKVHGKDDVTGELLTQRPDDSVDTWKQRLKKFEETSTSLLKHYEEKGCLFRVEGNSSDEISPKLFKEIERRFT
ncbi:P-loop containing nucleoside triphosphate hydrolase protein [Elaphomyces granulatus]